MALEGPYATFAEQAAAFNAARQPGNAIMSDSGVVFGPGDVPEVIDEPDYEKSLEAAAAIFGGDKELYRVEGMTQQIWASLGVVRTLPGEVPMPQEEASFFDDILRPLPTCCQVTLANATEHLAVISARLFTKSEETLDLAQKAALEGSTDRGAQLCNVAMGYKALGEAAL